MSSGYGFGHSNAGGVQGWVNGDKCTGKDICLSFCRWKESCWGLSADLACYVTNEITTVPQPLTQTHPFQPQPFDHVARPTTLRQSFRDGCQVLSESSSRSPKSVW